MNLIFFRILLAKMYTCASKISFETRRNYLSQKCSINIYAEPIKLKTTGSAEKKESHF